MSDLTNAARAMTNALQFLSPLVELEKMLSKAAGAEQFLADAGPRLQALKQQETNAEADIRAAEDDLGRIHAQLAEARKSGEDDVRRRVREVETQMATALQETQVKHAAIVRAREHEQEGLRRASESLLAARNELASEVAQLQDQILDLRGELATIVKRIGGA